MVLMKHTRPHVLHCVQRANPEEWGILRLSIQLLSPFCPRTKHMQRLRCLSFSSRISFTFEILSLNIKGSLDMKKEEKYVIIQRNILINKQSFSFRAHTVLRRMTTHG